MKKLHCCILGFFLLIVTAEQEEFQGNLIEKTKGTTVTKDLLWKKENTIGHGTEAIPTENTHQHTVEVATAKFPRAVLFDTRQTQAYRRIQITKASSVTALASRERSVSRNVHNSLTSANASALSTLTITESDVPLKSSQGKIVLSSAQAVLEPAINDTSGPQVHFSADTVKAPPWFHALRANRNQRKSNSVTLTSAGGRLGFASISASPRRVIDNLAALRNNNDDKQVQGNNRIATSGRGAFLSSTMQSILQSDPTEDSLRGNTMTDLCLTCLDDKRAASTEKSVTLPALSPRASSDSLGTERLALDLNQFPAASHSIHQQSAGKLDKVLKEMTHRNTTKTSSFIDSFIFNQTFLSFFFDQTINPSISNRSHIKSFSDTGMDVFDAHSLAETSTVKQKDNKKQSLYTAAQETSFRVKSATTVIYPLSKSLYTDVKLIKNIERDMFGKKISLGDPQSKLMYFSTGNKDASSNLSVNFKNGHISSKPLSNLPFKAEGTSLIEAHSAITPVSLGRPTITAVKTLKSHVLTVKADSFISAFMGKTRSKQSFQTKESISTLLPQDFTIKRTSVDAATHMRDKQDSQIFNTEQNIVKQPSVDTPVQVNKSVTTDPKKSSFATQTDVPVKFLPSESRPVFGDDVSVMTLIQPSMPFSDKPTSTLSKITQGRTFYDPSDRHVKKTHYLLSEYNKSLITEPQSVHKMKMEDKSEVILTVAEKREIIKIEDKQRRDIQKTEEIIQMHDEEQRTQDKFQGNNRAGLLRLDKKESGNLEKIINYRAEINQNIDRKTEKRKEFSTKTNTEEHVTLRQGKDPKQGKEDAEREGVTKINSEYFTQDTAERHREILEAEGTEGESKEPLSREDMKCNKDIGKKDMTNVPLEATTNSKELRRDKGHSVTNPSSCHTLIKELVPTEQNGIHLGEKAAQIEEITNNSFSYKVTSNHRTLHSILRSQRPKLSQTTSMPKESYSHIKLHLSTHRAMLPKHGATSPLSTTSSQNKKVTFSLSAEPKLPQTPDIIASKFSDVLKPTASQHSKAAKAARPFQHSTSNSLSLTTPPLPITAGILRAQSHFTVNTSLNLSIMHSITDHRHGFNISVLRANSVLHTGRQAEYIIPSMNIALNQQMYNDLSTNPPTETALSSEAHISIGQLQPRQGQSAAQRSQSSSCSDMTSGQPCSFKLSLQASHPDALYVRTDDNKQRFVQTLMPPMSPKVGNNQYSLSSLSPMLTQRMFGGGSLPVTYGLPRLTRSASVKKTLPINPENANIKNNKPLLVTVHVGNPSEGNDRAGTMVTSKVKHSDMVMEVVEKKTNKRSSSFASPAPVRIKNELISVSVTQPENDNNFSVFNADGKGETNSITTLKQNHSSQLHGAGHKTEKAKTDDFVQISNDSKIPWPVINGVSAATAFISSEMPKMVATDVTNITFDVEHHAVKMETQTPSLTQHSVSDTHVFFHHLAEQIINVTSQVQMIPAKINEFSPKPTANTGDPNVSKEDYKSPLTTAERAPVSKRSSVMAVEHMLQSKSHSESLSMRESFPIPTSDKKRCAVKRESTKEMQSKEQPVSQISVQVSEESMHAFPAVTVVSRPLNESESGFMAGFFKPRRRAEGAHSQTSAVVGKIERMNHSSFEDIQPALTTKSAVERPLPKKVYGAYTQDRREKHKRRTLPEKTSMRQAISGAMTDSVPPVRTLPVDVINKIKCTKSGETTKTTNVAAVIDHTEEMYKRHSGITVGNPINEQNLEIKQKNVNHSSESLVSRRATPQSTEPKVVPLPVSRKSEHHRARDDETMSRKARNMSDITVHLERHWTPQWAELVKKTTRRKTHGAHRAVATEAALSETEAATVQTRITSTEETLFADKNTKTQLNRGVEKKRFDAQNANRSIRVLAEKETAGPQSGSSLLPSEPESESELLWLNLSRRTSPHLYLSGVSEVSDDLCGSGNYTAEMSLNLGRGIEPGDAVPATGSLRVAINLKTNSSQINLSVTSCCLSPTIQPDLIHSTCCLFSRLAAEPAGITLLPSALSTSASFTISLFQMINYSVVYLHCDLSICLRNHSGCERCIQQRSTSPSEGPDIIVSNLRNRISFGPMLRQVKNSTFPQEIDPSELDLVLVIVSLVIGFCVVSVMVMLVWLAYRRRAMRLLHSAAPSQVCCGCLHPRGDLILP